MKVGFRGHFVMLAFASVVIVSIGSAVYLSRLLAHKTIHHDAREVAQFVQSFAPDNVALDYFTRTTDRDKHDTVMAPFLERLASMPGVIHVNVYDAFRKVLWSTKPEMVGKVLPINEELDEAFEGELAVESNLLEPANYLKPEHLYLKGEDKNFVEAYVPIWRPDHSQVIGVIDLYREPAALFEMSRAMIRGVWLAALVSGLFLFAALYWLARRADRIIQGQQQQLVETETLVAVGEMAGAIAHSIRNPLASIRSAAELTQELSNGEARGVIGEILQQVDRIASWITQLLVYSQPGTPKLAKVDLAQALERTVLDFKPDLEKHGIQVTTDIEPNLPSVTGDSTVLGQVFNTLLSNAVDAMPGGGKLELVARRDPKRAHVEVTIRDTGKGMAAEQLERLFVPFSTTKERGLGVGLPLVRRVLARLDGGIEVQSTSGAGTVVRLTFQAG